MNAEESAMLEKLRLGLKFVLMSMGISTPEKKTSPAAKPVSKSEA
jgi:hypothetical protein